MGLDTNLTYSQGVNLEDKIVKNVLDKHVPLAKCRPKELWKLKINKNGATLIDSFWLWNGYGGINHNTLLGEPMC